MSADSSYQWHYMMYDMCDDRGFGYAIILTYNTQAEEKKDEYDLVFEDQIDFISHEILGSTLKDKKAKKKKEKKSKKDKRDKRDGDEPDSDEEIVE